MNNVETPSSQLINEDAVSKEHKTTLLSDLKSLVKIGIVNSNLITAFAGFWLALHFTNASFQTHWGLFLLTMAGSALVIAGGCMLNNWYDVDIDPAMSRTKNRPTVTGRFSLPTVLWLGIGTTALGLILLLLTTVEAALIGFFGWFVYVVLYTIWSKRRYTLNTVVGSFSGAVPPLIGWAAVDPNFHLVPLVLFLIMFIWQTPHFLALAMKKTKEYKAAGIPMLPAVHGFGFTKRQIIVYIACLLPLPFFLAPLGTTFLVIATLLNVGWLIIGIRGFFAKNDLKWANTIFVYSINYLTILFLMMVVVTLPMFG
ncbi:protoheme IX farnesyltransferase [Virgibacillus natechei]|uniref:Protoheme IX farnesyltransferase n=1 Tax=Virgibacillus natechei TaxID=1216297 RepID=A0ABS4IBK1_9BACI|nr:heme o synthase [Virgibacillus natechei]MBP1968228.1 protoheme IX farnesyltransferase [Virgibacillus natechei]UZD14501.1 heme o synthase [Virgibacillus natechei]